MVVALKVSSLQPSMIGRRAICRFESSMCTVSFDDFTVDGVKKLADLRVTDVIVGLRNVYDQETMPPEKKIDAFRLYAGHVIAKR
jgi:hypothetical protein